MADTTIHSIEDGESAASVALASGRTIDEVWNASENKDLRDRGRTPHIVAPGDHLALPPAKKREFQLATGQRHKIVIPLPKSKLKLRFLKLGEPRANQKCVVTIDGKQTTKTTDGAGNVEVDVSPLAKDGSVVVGDKDPITYTLKLRGIHPSSVVTGWQARLQNLGYPVGAVDGDAGRRSQASLCAFQDDQKLTVTGEADKSTGAQLEKVHGC